MDEEFTTVAGFNSFIRYVCGGMTYEQFIPKGKNVRLNAERLGCLEFFLESVDAWATYDYKAKAKDLNILMRVMRNRNDVPSSIVGLFKRCLTELRKTPANAESVQKEAKSSRQELSLFRERTYLRQLIKVQQWNTLSALLETLSGCQSLSGQFPEENIKDLHRLLNQTEESVKRSDFEPKVIRANLKKIHVKLTETSALLKATEAEVIAKDMDKVAEGLKSGLRIECVLPMDSELALENLLSDLKPHQGTRRCRPYEIFLFAAQHGLCREELVRKRSSLIPGVVTARPIRVPCRS